MGLVEDIQSAVSSAFTAIGNIPVAVVYHPAGSPADLYTPTTGAIVDNGPATVALTAVKTNFDKMEIDGVNIRPFDRRLIIEAAKLIDAGGTLITPTLDDRVVFESKTWDVVGIVSDPTTSVWLVQVRTPQT